MIPSACVGDDLLLFKVVVLQRSVDTWLSVPGRGYIISRHVLERARQNVASRWCVPF